MRLVALVFILLSFAFVAVAQETGLSEMEILAKMLYAKNSEENAYCQYIIQQRDNGTLPEKIFYAVYRRAVEKEKSRRFIYFRTSIEILCKREGIVLPAFSAAETKKITAFLWTNTATKPVADKADAGSSVVKKTFSFASSWFKR